MKISRSISIDKALFDAISRRGSFSHFMVEAAKEKLAQDKQVASYGTPSSLKEHAKKTYKIRKEIEKLKEEHDKEIAYIEFLRKWSKKKEK